MSSPKASADAVKEFPKVFPEESASASGGEAEVDRLEREDEPINKKNMQFPNPFDFSAMSNILNDASIKMLAQDVSRDPVFQQMAQKIHQSVKNANRSDSAQFDLDNYVKNMQKVMQNPQFMTMAQQLCQAFAQDPTLINMIQSFSVPAQKAMFDERLAEVKKDPVLKPVLDEISKGGPTAMMKYWNDPVVLRKLGRAFQMQKSEGASAFQKNVKSERNEIIDNAEQQASLALLHASSTDDVKELQTLLSKGVDKDEKDVHGRTALHFACGYGNVRCVEVLLKEGAFIDIVDKHNNRPLHYASGYGQYECAELLLKHGASVYSVNFEGNTPIDAAKLNNQMQVLSLLEKYAGRQQE